MNTFNVHPRRDPRVSLPLSGNYAWPGVDADDEYTSLRLHLLAGFNTAPPPSAPVMEETLDVLEEIYSSARWTLEPDFLSDDTIRGAIGRLKGPSSPGYPVCQKYTTNSVFVEKVGVEMILQMVKHRLSNYREGKLDCADPVRLFVKREWHKVGKIRKNMVRLIWSVGVIDQLCNELIFGSSMAQEIAHHHQIPSKVGHSLFKGGADNLVRALDDGLGKSNYGSTDRSKHDWTVPAWQYDADVKIRYRLMTNPLSAQAADWLLLASALNECSKYKNIVLSDGTTYRQERSWTCECGRVIDTGGIVASGGKRTISMNSRSVVTDSIMFNVIRQLPRETQLELASHIAAVGDDEVKKFHEDPRLYRDWITSRGYIIEDDIALTKLVDTEFCSHGFKKVAGKFVAIPTNWEKHSYMLSFKEEGKFDFLIDHLFSMCLEYAFVEEKFSYLYGMLYDQLEDHPEKAALLRSPAWFKNFNAGYGIQESLRQTRDSWVALEFHPID